MRCTGLAYTLQLQPISLQQMQQRRACQSVSSDVCIAALSGGLYRHTAAAAATAAQEARLVDPSAN